MHFFGASRGLDVRRVHRALSLTHPFSHASFEKSKNLTCQHQMCRVPDRLESHMRWQNVDRNLRSVQGSSDEILFSMHTCVVEPYRRRVQEPLLGHRMETGWTLAVISQPNSMAIFCMYEWFSLEIQDAEMRQDDNIQSRLGSIRESNYKNFLVTFL